jgi:beta-phosphoglucomutase
MEWIEDYQLFLFDFDGLLVNTEELHYKAYQLTCKEYGFELGLDFPEYCKLAHYRAEGLMENLCGRFPEIEKLGWNVFYKKKTDTISNLIDQGAVQLMPGVEALLERLEAADKKRCVVTHSPDRIINPIRSSHKILDTIPVWITREYYTNPKPHPECYQTAIERLAKPEDRIVGFEDSPRGLRAMMGTRAQPVLISEISYPEIGEFIKEGAFHYPSFEAIPHNRLG